MKLGLSPGPLVGVNHSKVDREMTDKRGILLTRLSSISADHMSGTQKLCFSSSLPRLASYESHRSRVTSSHLYFIPRQDTLGLLSTAVYDTADSR